MKHERPIELEEDGPDEEHLVQEPLPLGLEKDEPPLLLPHYDLVAQELPADLARVALDLHPHAIVEERADGVAASDGAFAEGIEGFEGFGSGLRWSGLDRADGSGEGRDRLGRPHGRVLRERGAG